MGMGRQAHRVNKGAIVKGRIVKDGVTVGWLVADKVGYFRQLITEADKGKVASQLGSQGQSNNLMGKARAQRPAVRATI